MSSAAANRNWWKSIERRVGKLFGVERTPLSGGNSKITRSDTLHTRLFIEIKAKAKHSVITLWDATKELALKEQKTPVVILAEKGRPGVWIIVHSKDLHAVAREMGEHIGDPE